MSKKFKGGAALALLGVFLGVYLIVALINYVSYSEISRVDSDIVVQIPTNSTIEQQAAILVDFGAIKDSSDYMTYAKMMDIGVGKPGNYNLKEGMSYKDIMVMMQMGWQSPVKVTFIPALTINQIAGRVSKSIEADSISILEAFKSDSLHLKYGVDSLSFSTIFIPNTYEFYWNTSAEEFMDRMYKEYKAFWSNNGREQRLAESGMTRLEIMTLASIIYGETKHTPEMARISGVYMNRLRKGIKLQADPTVVYAHGDWSIRRVLHKHLTIDSPYNTYKYKGLPPSPINFPAISAIDAALWPEKNDYIYFCASEKFDGTHNFAKTYSQHLANARKYSRELTKRGIR